MSLASYTALQAAVIRWASKPELAQEVPDFIAMAEAVMNRRLRVRRMVAYATATIDAAFEDLTPDFAGLLYAQLSDGRQLEQLTAEELAFKQMQWNVANVAAEPVYIAVVGNQMQFLPTPDQPYTMNLLYYAQIPPLADNPTNWLLSVAPDAYLYGTLMQVAPYLGDDARIPIWERKFDQIMAELKANDSRETYGGRLQTRSTVVI